MRQGKISIWLVALMVGAGLQACGGSAGDGGGNDVSPPIKVPANPAEQWTLVAPADVGMDAATLARAADSLPAASVHKLASMLVLRHGKPVLERYWNGYDKDTMHDLRSATKSITSLLVGIAVDQGAIGGVRDPLALTLSGAYPQAPVLARGLVLEDLLSMRSGLACNDWDSQSPGNESKMYQTTDWVGFYLNLPQTLPPGTTAQYCTGNPVALGRVIAGASHASIPDFANKNLFGPLGIAQYRWASFDNGRQTDTGGHLYLRPRDMARIGQLALQRGQWNGTQVVSAAWVDQSTSKHTEFIHGDGSSDDYGYLWWRTTEPDGAAQVDMFFADGNGGQRIIVVPTLDMVIVFTGENYDSAVPNVEFSLVRNDILPAVLE